jgi:rhodanese-related sulfurtransferase
MRIKLPKPVIFTAVSCFCLAVGIGLVTFFFSPSNERRRPTTEEKGAGVVRAKVRTPVTDRVKALTSAWRDEARDDGGNHITFPYAELQPDAVSLGQLEGALVLDLRSRDEFEREHVPGALNIPIDELPHRMDDLPGRELTILYFTEVEDPDRPGYRLKPTPQELNPLLRELFFVRRGYIGIAAGGLDAWKAAGQPTVGREVPLFDSDKFKREVDENLKAWDEFRKAAESARPTTPSPSPTPQRLPLTDYPTHDDLFNAKGQLRK